MLANRGYAAYANNKVMTASPAELTLMLYEGAIKFANIAIEAIEAKDIQKAHDNIMKVERIIEEFQSTLNHKYPVAKDFDEVYNYLMVRLTVTFNVSVFSGQVFCTYIYGFCFDGGTCRPAVSGVILSYGYVWINGRNGYGASFPFNKGTADGQPFQWMYHKAAYNIFLIVFIF